ncbi:MAG: DNA repair protein RecO [Methylobacteriaceae bacterium]|nr:DNA repair protein RecO [Methylobacteriaceae bacterium]
MQWRDEGVIIGVKRHGETSVIVELMTRDHGRHLGLVRGGRSRRLQGVLQPANSVEATWRARLDEHLGTYTVEGTVLRAAEVMTSACALDGINLIAALLRLLPERDPHTALYEALAVIVEQLTDVGVAPALMVRFELGILGELGFGLDLTRCAATGSSADLVFVSPKSGRAVSRAAGGPYRERLLALPPFLGNGSQRNPSATDIVAGFALTSHFLLRDVFEPRGLAMPSVRAAYIERTVKTASA